jgi:hypothetical protein
MLVLSTSFDEIPVSRFDPAIAELAGYDLTGKT